ncbi:MAG: hypothetical protein IJU95_01350 [Treponema sp.]|nr:hypothetical protein [Treponema sp.]
MKLEKVFCVESNKLYYIEGKKELPLASARLSAPVCVKSFNTDESIPPDLSKLLLLELPWSQVGCDEYSYNEDFLASFRDFLKALEEKGGYVAIIPVPDRPLGDGQDFTASFKHCARRIKDCASVAGFAIPSGIDAELFISELSAKHAQYVFFSANSGLLEKPDIVRLED